MDDPPTYQTAQLKIDDQIAHLESQIMILKSSRNALAPISRLHTELLLEIFLLTRQSSPQYSQSKTALAISWVSHTWRDLAINLSSLWTHIDFIRSPEWMRVSLTRAKGRGLEYSLDLTGPGYGMIHNWDVIGPLIMGNISRMEKLDIKSSFSQALLFQLKYPEWEGPAPLLVELYLHSIVLPPNPFGGVCPVLQSIHLISCHVEWAKFPTFPMLKDLVIEHTIAKLGVGVLMNIIRGSGETLESLRLVYSLSVSPGEQLPTIDRVQLDRLKTLEYEDENPHAVVGFLKLVSFPHLTKTSLFVEGWQNEIPALFLAARNLSNWEIERLELGLDEKEECFQARIFESRSGLDEGHRQHIETKLKTHLCVDIPTWFAYFGLPPVSDSITHLHISPMFSRIFFTFLKHQVLRLSSALKRPNNVPSPLVSDKDAWLPLAIPHISFPNLRVLEMHGNYYEDTNLDGGTGERKLRGLGTEVSKSGSTLKLQAFRIMKAWLELRNTMEIGLDRLVVKGFAVTELKTGKMGLIRLLEEVVGEVEIGEIFEGEEEDVEEGEEEEDDDEDDQGEDDDDDDGDDDDDDDDEEDEDDDEE